MAQQQNNQDNSDWKDEAEQMEAEIWAIREGIDGEMLNWIWEEAKNSKAEFYDLCHKELNRRPVFNYTPEMEELDNQYLEYLARNRIK
jgi:hypothetical protein